jgi:hypothetical protein
MYQFPDVRVLDLFVFHGGDFVSGLIDDVEHYAKGDGSVTHIGLAINHEWCPSIKFAETATGEAEILVWESIMSGPLNDGVPDAESGKSRFGVQVRELDKVTQAYLSNPRANIGLCRLRNNPCVQQTDETELQFAERKAVLTEKISKIYMKYDDRTYNANPIDLFAAVFPQLQFLRDLEDETLGKWLGMNQWLFCSELVAAVYEDVGIIADASAIDYRNIAPVDFLPNAHSILSSLVESPIWLR